MKYYDFDHYVYEMMDHCITLLISKGEEYAECKDSEEDRLSQFKMAANLMNSTQEMALLGMASKHFVSVAKLCIGTETGNWENEQKWFEKIADAINYLLILYAMVHEQIPTYIKEDEGIEISSEGEVRNDV